MTPYTLNIFFFYFSFLNVLCPVHHLVGKTPICFLVRNCGSFVALNDVIWEAHNCKIGKFLTAFDIWWWLEEDFERLWRTLRRQTSSLVYTNNILNNDITASEETATLCVLTNTAWGYKPNVSLPPNFSKCSCLRVCVKSACGLSKWIN